MSENDAKRQNEEKLVSLFHAIPFMALNLEWLASDEYRNFVNSWKDLLNVYIENDTFTDFNVEVVASYRDITRHLYRYIIEVNVDKELNNKANEALEEIEYWMDELIKEAERNQNNIDSLN